MSGEDPACASFNADFALTAWNTSSTATVSGAKFSYTSRSPAAMDFNRRPRGSPGLVRRTPAVMSEAGLGLNPQSEGQTIRVPIPDLTEERRRELTRVAAKYAEQARIAIRNVRHAGLDPLKKKEKDGYITQDQHRKLQHDIQALTDQYIKKIDELFHQKEKEILHV